MDKEQYERELAEKRRLHLDAVRANKDKKWIPCKHDECPKCVGTRVTIDGFPCVHAISCPCPKCSHVSSFKELFFSKRGEYNYPDLPENKYDIIHMI